jgi:hypothetical protein
MRTITDAARVVHVPARRDPNGALVGDIIDIPNLPCRSDQTQDITRDLVAR